MARGPAGHRHRAAEAGGIPERAAGETHRKRRHPGGGAAEPDGGTDQGEHDRVRPAQQPLGDAAQRPPAASQADPGAKPAVRCAAQFRYSSGWGQGYVDCGFDPSSHRRTVRQTQPQSGCGVRAEPAGCGG